MLRSRLRRHEERQARRRLSLALFGTIFLVAFIILFGLKILVGFSLLIDRIRGPGAVLTQSPQTIIIPPVLDPLPSATNSTNLIITGQGQPELTLVLFVNEKEHTKLTIPKDGIFKVPNIPAEEGTITISARLTDDKGNTSDLSNVVSVQIIRTPPKLEITSPEENQRFSGARSVQVSGLTEEETQISINGRIAVVHGNGSFTYDYPVSAGDITLSIVATDIAGNQTRLERKIIVE